MQKGELHRLFENTIEKDVRKLIAEVKKVPYFLFVCR